MTRLRISRAELDAWLPTFVRYLGLLALVYGAFIDRFSNPAIIPAAMGMLLFKSIFNDGRRE